MTYYIDVFSPETYEAFTRSGKNISGFRTRQQRTASRVRVGDKLVCYMTKLSRWVGILEVASKSYKDDTPVFYEENDPFVIRFKVEPVVWLEKEKAIPIRDDKVWNNLSFTQGFDKNSSAWTGKFRGSLTKLNDQDGRFLEKLLMSANNDGKVYPVDQAEYNKYLTHRVRTADKVVTVSIPQDAEAPDEDLPPSHPDVRESTKIQAMLARIGAKMGLRIWLPRNNRNAVLAEGDADGPPLLDALPLNYDESTIKTIEQIDVLWLRGRAIVRAFEVEHTTSVYSGLLRMADLLALQPNMDIRLHIVAPGERRDKVFQELQRPVFSLLERGPLSESCTYLSYDSIRELSQLRHLAHTTDSVLDEYAEEAE